MGTVRAMPTIRLVIEEGYQQLAPLAACALRQLGDTITADDVLAWLNSPISDDRLRAVLALLALVDQDALPHLLRALSDHDSSVRAEAARQLGRLGDQSVIPFLTDALKDEDEEVCRAAHASLDFLAERRGHQPLPQGTEPE
jgi:HEAT repeat protein